VRRSLTSDGIVITTLHMLGGLESSSGRCLLLCCVEAQAFALLSVAVEAVELGGMGWPYI
jgi:hypothetical protein